MSMDGIPTLLSRCDRQAILDLTHLAITFRPLSGAGFHTNQSACDTLVRGGPTRRYTKFVSGKNNKQHDHH